MLGKAHHVSLNIRYILKLPFVAFRTIILDGWPTFRRKFKNWLHVAFSGQLVYEIQSRNSINLPPRQSTLFADKIDFFAEIMQMAGTRSRAFELNDSDLLDVVVPIYNAYDDLLMCLYSLLKHQDIYRIILIDDCSTDPRIRGLLTALSRCSQEAIQVEFNAQNLGFLSTVNKGMQITWHDIILLNTDTIVTHGWARKMKACAQSDQQIATITHFTNNGRMCSIPNFLQDNDLPEGFTVDSFAECVEKASSNSYPELVTAVGFCMYIRRSVIDDIGFFDAENFGKGYGEEVDFSFRAVDKGYKNVLCDNTFIYHKGKASFQDTQLALMEKNHIFLSEKYPKHWAAIARFEKINPLAELQRNLKIKVDRERSRGSIA